MSTIPPTRAAARAGGPAEDGDDPARGHRHRYLDTPSLAFLVVANMVGAGVFTTSGFALADLGSPARVLSAWAVGGVVALLGAVCYGALSMRLQESGGEYLFLSRTIHPTAGFLAGWVSLWAGFTGAIGIAAKALGAYLAPAGDGLAADLIGSGAILAAALLHTVRAGVRIQDLVVGTKMVLLTGFSAWGLWQLASSGTGIVDAAPTADPGPFPWFAFAGSLVWISLSYSGWNAAVYVAGEAKDPTRTVPRALLLGTGAVTLLYLALNTVFVFAAPIERLAGQPDVAAVAARALGGPPAELAVRAVLAVALSTSITGMVLTGPRVYARMAADGCMPAVFGRGMYVPVHAVWIQAGLAVAVVWIAGLQDLLGYLGLLLSISTALAVVGLLRLRRAEGRDAVPIPGHPVVPFAFLAAVFATAGMAAFVQEQSALAVLATLGSGLLVRWIRPPRRS